MVSCYKCTMDPVIYDTLLYQTPLYGGYFVRRPKCTVAFFENLSSDHIAFVVEVVGTVSGCKA